MNRRLLLALAVCGAGVLTVHAQDAGEYAPSGDKNLFNHLGIGASVGLDGIGFDVAAPIGHYVQVRAGYSFLPKIKPTIEVGYDYDNGRDPQTHWESKGEISITKNDFKLLFDAYPFRSSSFHVTAGAFIGSGQLATLRNKGKLAGVLEEDYGTAKIAIGEGKDSQMFGTDPDGNVKGRFKVGGFKPYLGIGFGRVVPNKLVSVNFDIGVQFWGTPHVEIYDYDPLPEFRGWKRIEKEDFGEDEDMYDVMKIVNKITVYPSLNLRIGFRAF